MPSKTTIRVRGRTIQVSNLDKVFYPKTGFTKGDVIDYYAKIAASLLPHLEGRPVTLKRYPDGVEGEFFYEKQCPSHAPKWIKTTRVRKKSGASIDYCMINDLPALVWSANMANLELHSFAHRVSAPSRPTAVVFDLDPGPPADIKTCCRVALTIKRLLDAMNLRGVIKTSGSKGLQLLVPLNTPVTYHRTKAFARRIAQALAHHDPGLVVAEMRKALRKGKVFIDWSQNDGKKTTVCVYSLRAVDEPSVSTPLTWKEVAQAAQSHRSKVLRFPPREVLARVRKRGDLFAAALSIKQRLPSPAAWRIGSWRKTENL